MRKIRAGVLFILIFIVIFFLKSDSFKIHSLSLNLLQVNCTDEKNLKEKSNLLNKNIFFIDEKNTTFDLKNKFICIKDVQIAKNLPDKISMNIKGRVSVAELIPVLDLEASVSALIENTATPSASLDAYLVDDEGVIFAKGFADVSKIYYSGKPISLGGKLTDEYLNKTLFILKLLKEFMMDDSKLYIVDNLLITNSYPKVIFRLDKEKEEQIASLQLILQKAKIDNKELEFIDLRFDKPIVKYAPKK